MKNAKRHWEQLRQYIKEHPTTAKQGLTLTTPAPGQLHRPVDALGEPDVFYLITEVQDDYVEVIPGSFDSMMACTDDIILPKSVFGKFTFLSLNLSATLPASAIGEGFAVLDDDTYNRIIDSQLEYETGEKGELPSFPFAALPYFSKSDPRKYYHDRIAEIIIIGGKK
jgi:hypothetical protein